MCQLSFVHVCIPFCANGKGSLVHILLLYRYSSGSLVFGSSLLHVPDSYPHKRTVVKVIRHPLYSYVDHRHDIALLRLDSPVELTDTIRPACLATEDNELEIYHTCHAVGWGRTSQLGK